MPLLCMSNKIEAKYNTEGFFLSQVSGKSTLSLETNDKSKSCPLKVYTWQLTGMAT